MSIVIILLCSLHLASHNHADAHEETKRATRCQSNHRDHKELLSLVGVVEAGQAAEDASYDCSHFKALEELGLCLACRSEYTLHLSCEETIGFFFFFLIFLKLTVN